MSDCGAWQAETRGRCLMDGGVIEISTLQLAVGLIFIILAGVLSLKYSLRLEKGKSDINQFKRPGSDW